MTREEAIKILKECRERKLKYTFYTLDEYQAATDMAIQALKQEPCEDVISRQAAIEAIYACYIGGKEAVDKAPYSDHYAEGIDEAVNAVEDLPSVSAEKTGRWILTDKEEEIYCHVAICSVCGKESINEGVDDYCSWCGAKMEVEE